MKHRHLWSWLCGMILVMFLMAGCGSTPPAAGPTDATDIPTDATDTPAETADTPAEATDSSNQRGDASDTLRILYWQAPTILNPHLASGTKDYDAARLILEPLATITPDGTPAPVLAAEIPTVDNGGVAEDLSSVTWTLKPDVVWSDGAPFTAADVVFTYEYCSTEATACTNAASFDNIASVEAIDDYTVQITWEMPNPNPYQTFVTRLGVILQKAQFENCVGEAAAADAACQEANLAPIGTGPYKLREFKPGDVVTYDINENYRESGKPFFKEVQFKGGGDAPSAARAVFQTGDVDYAWNLQVEAAVINQLLRGGRGELITAQGGNVERLLFNFANPDPALGDARGEPDQPHPFLTDVNVRKALALAVDRQVMAEQLYGPAGDPTCEIIVSEPYISLDQIYGGRRDCSANIEEANRLLDQAGWIDSDGDGIRDKDGVKMSILYQTSVNSLRQKEQELVKQAWDQLGVETELKSVDAGVFFDSAAGNLDNIAHFFADVQMFTNGSEQTDQTNYLCQWTTGEIAQRSTEWRGNNQARYSNPDYDALCDQLRTESDPEARADLVMQMNDILIEDAVIVPLVARKSVFSGIASDLKGVNPSGWDSEMWNIADWYRE
ncbi:MAG: peptide ABC transporter substrate-binding protein [Chloroflexales bacterium]|nr:peptide ABC transporter substrate-binding protein [Chloroflexales bacterium]